MNNEILTDNVIEQNDQGNYNEMASFVTDGVNTCISEINRIASVYEESINDDCKRTHDQIVQVLNSKFGSFINNHLSNLEQIIGLAINTCSIIYSKQLHEVTKTITSQYLYTDTGIGSSLYRIRNIEAIKRIIGNIKINFINRLQVFGRDENNTVMRAIINYFDDNQTKIDDYLQKINLQNGDLCADIIQTVDMYLYDMLDRIQDVIPALIEVSVQYNELLHKGISNKFSVRKSDLPLFEDVQSNVSTVKN